MQRQDRYVTFKGIDCEGMTRATMERVLRHVAAGDSPFWPYFEAQRTLAHRRGFDDLRVLHNFLPTLKELLDDLDDTETLALLEELERQCM
jgi:N(2)-fixation sustaining protein CowN